MEIHWGVRLLAASAMSAYLLVAPSQLLAQEPAATLGELQSRVTTAQTVTVVDTSGEKVRGQISGLSDQELRLMVDGKPRTFTPQTLVEVRAPHKDSLWNGVVIGGLAGSAYLIGLAASNWCSDEGPNCGGGYAWGAAWIGIGAGTGAAIDAVRKGQITVYRRSKVALGVAPVLTGRIRSVSAWVRF